MVTLEKSKISRENSENFDRQVVSSLRLLAVDMVEKAKSGHPGMPLGAAPMAYVLWSRFLRHNPRDPQWIDRDRFVLSAGHGSALLYSLLHLYGYGLTLADLKEFRQWGSKTPGHPEWGHTPGVECTTGPLGQGFAMGVGMAIAESFLAQRFNRPGLAVVDHYTYAIVSDGDLMEGVASEAASLAGHLKLGKLIYLYDDNQISIEGKTDLTFTENVSKRFESYGWQVLEVEEGNDLHEIERALLAARKNLKQPSLIRVKTQIGFGSPKQGTAQAHGEPLGAEATRQTKERFQWSVEAQFHVPEAVSAGVAQQIEVAQGHHAKWKQMWGEYTQRYPQEATQLQSWMRGELPAGWQKQLPTFSPNEAMATRDASGKILNALAAVIENLMGGSADLAPSTKTLINGSSDFNGEKGAGRNLRFGVREHAMAAAANGMALHGGILPYVSTFFAFVDYLRPALRLSALQKVPVIYVLTHDSLFLGEDGPTHQPIEHLAILRATPDFITLRPADANETAAAWKLAMELRQPMALILSRQKLPILNLKEVPVEAGVARGGYIAADSKESPQAILIACGSELHLALAARVALEAKAIPTRVVSLPSWELFQRQSQKYRDQVLPPKIKNRIAIEAGVSFGWERFVGEVGQVIGIDSFGASAPAEVLADKFGFTVEKVVAKVLTLLKRKN